MSSVWDELNDLSDFDEVNIDNLKDEFENTVIRFARELRDVKIKITESYERISEVDDTLIDVIDLLKTALDEGADVEDIVSDAIEKLTNAKKELY